MQNEAIRINIDDSQVRSLNDVIADLKGAINDLNSAISTNVEKLQGMLSSLQPVSGSVDIVRAAFNNFENALRFTTIRLKTLQENMEFLFKIFPRLKNQVLAFKTTMIMTGGGIKGFVTAMGIAIGTISAKTIAIGVLKLALASIGIGVLIAAIGALVSAGGRLISWFSSASREARAHEKAVAELSEQYGVSTEVIESDMERMGKECTDTWEKVNEAAQDAANTFGGCADEIRGEIADLIAYHGDYDDAMEAFREQQIEMLTDVGKQWGMTGQEVYDALEDMTLDEFIAQQEAQLDELSEAWNICGSEIKRTLQEQGITMEEFKDQQEEILNSLAEEWGMSVEDIQDHMHDMGMGVEELGVHMSQAWIDLQNDIREQTGKIINNFQELPESFGKSADELIDIMYENRKKYNKWRENMAEITEDLCDTIGPEMIAFLESQGPEFNSVLEDMLYNPETFNRFSDEFEQTVEDATGHVIDGFEDPQVQQAAVHMLEHAGRSVSDSTVLEDSYEEVFDNANDRAVTVAEQGGSEAGEKFGKAIVESATSADYSAIPDAVTGAIDAGQSGMVQAMTSAATAIVSAFRTGMMPLKLTATTTLDPLVPLFQQSGRNMATGLQTGITSSTSSVTNAMTILATAMHTAFRTANEENSPSRLYRRSGGFIIDGLVAGLTAVQNRPTTRLQTIATNMQNVYNNVNSTYQAVGRDIINGVNSGLLGREAHLMATANRIAGNLARTMRNALQINSPSRVMREQIGRFIPEGIAAGIDKYADAAIDSVHKLSNDIINLNLPSVESMIGLQPSMRLSGATGVGSTNNDYSVVNNNQGLFEGANINWSGEQDIRRTMEKIAWVTKQEQARLWR